MGASSKHMSQSDIDRLVDGSLSGDAYRKMIQRLDSSSDGWKQCALTFLEQQALSRDFGEIINGQDAEVDVVFPEKSKPETGKSVPSMIETDRPFIRRWQGLLLATAASFLFAFGLGITANQMLGERGDGLAGPGLNGNRGTTNVSNQQTLPVVVQENLTGQQQQFDVPIVSNRNQDLGPAFGNQLPVSLDQLIQKMDVPYEVRRNMVSLTDKQGNVYYVPVDQIKFGKKIADYQ